MKIHMCLVTPKMQHLAILASAVALLWIMQLSVVALRSQIEIQFCPFQHCHFTCLKLVLTVLLDEATFLEKLTVSIVRTFDGDHGHL